MKYSMWIISDKKGLYLLITKIYVYKAAKIRARSTTAFHMKSYIRVCYIKEERSEGTVDWPPKIQTTNLVWPSWLSAGSYRVSHFKLSKVILLCWRYRFSFLLIFWVLCVHEKGTFMLNSSVFIFLMLRALPSIFIFC